MIFGKYMVVEKLKMLKVYSQMMEIRQAYMSIEFRWTKKWNKQ